MRFPKIASFLLGMTLMSSVAFATGDNLACGLIADRALDLPQSPLFELLNVELSSMADLALVERAQIEKVLQEQSLQLAFSPEGGPARRQLGQLIKADLLVIMKAGEMRQDLEKVRYVDVSISETRFGLRLYYERLAWDTKHPEITVAHLAAAIAAARGKLAEELKVIVAVPPFVSDDLTHVYDSLQVAYAQIIMRHLTAMNGVHVVELAEARALTDESELAAVNASIRPVMPFFVEGHYRNEGRGDGRKVNVQLAVSQAGATPEKREISDLPADSVENQLAELCHQWLARKFEVEPAPYEPHAEMALLRERAAEYRRLGDWKNALDMVETMLMIVPDDYDARRQAVELCGKMVDTLTEGSERPVEVSIDSVLAHLDYVERGCEHLARHLRFCNENENTKKIFYSGQFRDFMVAFWKAGLRIYVRGAKNDRLKERISELGKLKRDTLLEFYEYLGAQGKYLHLSSYPDYKIDFAYNVHAPILETGREYFEARLRGIKAFCAIEDAKRLETVTDLLEFSNEDQKIPELKEFIHDLATIPGDEYNVLSELLSAKYSEIEDADKIHEYKRINGNLDSRVLRPDDYEYLRKYLTSMCADLEIRVQNAESKKKKQNVKGKMIGDASGFANFQKMKKEIEASREYALKMSALNGNQITLKKIPEIYEEMKGWVALDSGQDILWSDYRIYMMRREGELNEIFKIRSPGRRITSVACDGQWIWIPGDEELVIANLSGKIVDRIDASDGLPPGELWVTPIGLGRICAVGVFDRAWCANVEYGGKGHKRVDVFHEARLKEGHPRDANLAFKPRFIIKLNSPDGTPCVLVGRSFGAKKRDEIRDEASFYPLLIDPERRSVKTLEERFSCDLDTDRIKIHDGRMFWVAKRDEVNSHAWSGGYLVDKPKDQIISWGAPDYKLRVETVPIGQERSGISPSSARLFFINKYPYVVREGVCWLIDLEGGRAIGQKTIFGSVLSRTGYSNFYGTVALLPNPNSDGYAYQAIPESDPRELMDSLDRSDAQQLEVVKKSLFMGREMVLRLASIHNIGSDNYTTLSVTLAEGGFTLDSKITHGEMYVWMEGADQPDEQLREFFKYTRYVWPPMGNWTSPFNTWDYGPCFFPLRDINPELPPQGLTILLTDPEGNPLENGNIHQAINVSGGNMRSKYAPLRFWSGKTDQNGKATLIVPNKRYFVSSSQNMEYIVSHPECGSVKIMINEKDEDVWKVPLVKPDHQNKIPSISGIIKASTGKPLSTYDILCHVFERPGIKKPLFSTNDYRWSSTDDGSFSIVPVPCVESESKMSSMPLGTKVYINIIPPADTGIPAKIYVMKTGEKFEIDLCETLSFHSIEIQNEMGENINPDEYSIFLAQKYPDCPQYYGDHWRIPEGLIHLDGQSKIKPVALHAGIYYADGVNVEPINEVYIDKDSPETIVLKVKITDSQEIKASKVKHSQE